MRFAFLLAPLLWTNVIVALDSSPSEQPTTATSSQQLRTKVGNAIQTVRSTLKKPFKNCPTCPLRRPSLSFLSRKSKVSASEQLIPDNKDANKRTIVLMFGAPCAGKGTACPPLTKHLGGIPQIATGDIMRAKAKEDDELGRKLKGFMNGGGLVPDEVTIQIFKERISQPDCQKGFLLDGFPRTVAQAQALHNMLQESNDRIAKIIDLQVADEILIQRSLDRWLHPKSGGIYNVRNSPPKSYLKAVKEAKAKGGDIPVPTPENMRDDKTGEALMQREDDNRDAMAKRLRAFHGETEPVVNYYENQLKIPTVHMDGNVSAKKLLQTVLKEFYSPNFVMKMLGRQKNY